MGAEAQLFANFSGATRRRMVAFAKQSPRLADLARTHPPLFITLATGCGDTDRRVAAMKAALDGRRLRTLCELAGIPYCLRRVPIALCPVDHTSTRWSAHTSPILQRCMPGEPTALSNWVRGIFFANAAAGEEFALWLADRHELFEGTPLDHRHLLPLALLFWFAQHPEHELHSVIPARWSMRAGSRRVLNATRAWLYRIDCRIFLPAPGEREKQSKQYPIGAYQAIELTNFRTLLLEQQLMDNCLDRYARRIAWGAHALFSLRTQTGDRVANFEVAIHAPDGRLVTEIRGRSNSDVPNEVRQAVLHWVETSSHLLRRPIVEHLALPCDPDDMLAELIAPYARVHKEILETCGPVTLRGLERNLAELAARLRINSWPICFERTSRASARDHRADHALLNTEG